MEVEHAGYLISYSDKNGNTRYSFIGPYPGGALDAKAAFQKADPDLHRVATLLKGVAQVATYHSHPAQIPSWTGPQPGNGRFSVADLQTHINLSLKGYVVGADGEMRKFTPNSNSSSSVCYFFVPDAICEAMRDNSQFEQGKIEYLGSLGPKPVGSCP